MASPLILLGFEWAKPILGPYKFIFIENLRLPEEIKCGENRNHGKFKIYFLMVEL